MIEPVIIGNATLYLAQCEAILPHLGNDLTGVMDPPYLFKASGGGKFRAARPCMDQIEAEDLDQGFDIDLLTAEQFRHLAVFCHNDQLHLVLPHFQEQFRRYVVCTWHKSNPLPVANKHFVPDTEPYVHTGQQFDPDTWPWVHGWLAGGHPIGKLRDKARFWIGQNGRQDLYNHPTVKPIDLMRKMVRNAPGDTIVDLFMGTGTTGAAALIEGRKFIGVEKKPEYFAMARDRIRRVYSDGLAKMPTGVAA